MPWRQIFALKQLWLITFAYFCYAWGSWFYFGWFTTWLVHGAGFTVSQMGVFASFPFMTGLAGNLLGGAMSERLVERYGRKRTYRWVTGMLPGDYGVLVGSDESGARTCCESSCSRRLGWA